MKKTLKKTSLVIGIIIIAIFVLMALAPGAFTAFERKEVFKANLECSLVHPFGTNALGYDVFTELVYACRETLGFALFAALISLVLSVLVGIGSTQKGVLGACFKTINDVFLMLPKMICFLVFASALGSSTEAIIFLCGIFSWAAGAKTISAASAKLYEMPFAENLKLEGFSKARIMCFHIIPNLMPLIRARFMLALNSCIMMQSTLAFLGIGDVYYPSLGTMVSLALDRGAILRGQYIQIIAPGLFIAALSFALYLINTYLESRRQY